MSNPRTLSALLIALTIGLGTTMVEAASITAVEDLRAIFVEAQAGADSDSDGAAPAVAFSPWDEQVVVGAAESGVSAGALALQESAVDSRGITGTGNASVSGEGQGEWSAWASTKLDLRFDVSHKLWFTFDGQLSAFGPLGTSTSLTLLHEDTGSLLIDETIQNDNLIDFSVGGALPAGTYELNLVALAERDWQIPGEIQTAAAQFRDVSFAVVPLPGAFAAGMLLLGGALLRRWPRLAREAPDETPA